MRSHIVFKQGLVPLPYWSSLYSFSAPNVQLVGGLLIGHLGEGAFQQDHANQ